MNISHKWRQTSWLAEQLLDSQGEVSKNPFYKICYNVYSKFVSSSMLQRKYLIINAYNFNQLLFHFHSRTTARKPYLKGGDSIASGIAGCVTRTLA